MQYCEFLEQYRKFSAGNETPENVHLWCAISALAGAAEKRVWINQGDFNLYLNLYILLLAPPGVVAKSVSVRRVRDLLYEGGFFTLEGSVLKEKIIEDMEAMTKEATGPNGVFHHSSVTYLASEFNVLLSSGSDMIQFLTNIFDEDRAYVYKTKKSGQYEVPHPHFNLLGAAVPKWFGGNVAGDMNATGLLARCIIVYEEEKRGLYHRTPRTEEQDKAKEKCTEILFTISQMTGEITLSEEADQRFYEWYMEHGYDSTKTSDYRIADYIERKVKIYVLKVAGLMAIGDIRQEITATDIERAIHLLDSIESKMKLAYIMSGSNKLAPYIYKAMTTIEQKNGSIRLDELMRMFYQDIDVEEVRKLISTIKDMGEVKEKRDESGNRVLVKN